MIKIEMTFTSFNGSQLEKLKRVFLSCYCHEMYKVEVVGLNNYNILEKLRFLWIFEVWGDFLKIDILPITSNLKILFI